MDGEREARIGVSPDDALWLLSLVRKLEKEKAELKKQVADKQYAIQQDDKEYSTLRTSAAILTGSVTF